MVGLRTCHSSFASSPRSSYARQEAFLLKQLFLFLFLLLVFFSSPLTQGQVSRTQQNPLSLPTQNRSNTPTSGMLDSEIFSLNFSLDFFTLFPIFKMKMHQLIIFFLIFFYQMFDLWRASGLEYFICFGECFFIFYFFFKWENVVCFEGFVWFPENGVTVQTKRNLNL